MASVMGRGLWTPTGGSEVADVEEMILPAVSFSWVPGMDFSVVQIIKYPNNDGSQGQNNGGIKVDPIATFMAFFRIDRLSISQHTE
jgi:hypothetical protein